jgi:hypothetical protein
MMVRTQVSFAPEEHRRAKQRAAELGVSLAKYVRRVVADDLHEPRPSGDVSRLFALGDSGGSDVAAHKDAYLAGAIASRRR